MIWRVILIVLLTSIFTGCTAVRNHTSLYQDEYIVIEKHGAKRLSVNGNLVLTKAFKAKKIEDLITTLGSESFLVGIKTKFSFKEWVNMSSQISLAGGQTYYLNSLGEIWIFYVVE